MVKRKPNKQRNHQKSQTQRSDVLFYGQHAVTAALGNAQRRHIRLYATKNAQRDLPGDLLPAELEIETCDAEQLSRFLPDDVVHQGLVLRTTPLPEQVLDDLIATGGLIILLDQVTDPRNVGAILRAAAVFGASGIVMTRHNSPPATGALAKTASGALEMVPLIHVANLARALQQINKAGYISVGLDETGEMVIENVPRDQPLACVMGAEGKGLRRLTRESCTMLARLPTTGSNQFTTLNVATAAAVTLYAITRAP